MSVRALAVATTLAGSLVLAACGGVAADQTDPGPAAEDQGGSGAAFPVTVQHAYGETVIPEQPERIATVGWSNQEAALALGEVPVIMEKATWGDDDGDGVLPWVEQKLTELGAETPAMYDGTDGVDFEAVADSAPDVILAAYSGLSQDDYDTLSQIAPVVAYPDVAWGTTWQETLTLNGTALGKQAEAQALVDDYENQIQEAVQGYENLDGQGAAFTWFDVDDLSQVGFYTTVDPRARFLSEQLGLAVPEAVAAAGEEVFNSNVSAEAVDTLSDLEVIVTYGTEADLATVREDPLLSRIPAVKNGAIVVLDDVADPTLAAAANPSPLGIPYLIENYLPLIEEAAAKAN
ncbi:iron-siderophore ABC transporter substrate-binding protein [Naumannella halotolerans]|uniref:Iron complex transport system substrate-binding protein n=1 Tax=Naumannella halotolerans TaxID=993414 RepID=A0A4R7J8T3_9ACTN|nr:iron-siderophore ABC transporter substrate-binding protein [Naumannella halotolerans]TDT33216.1 iron complex transport system substrate-binding protein [Naumannella halotolerans]